MASLDSSVLSSMENGVAGGSRRVGQGCSASGQEQRWDGEGGSGDVAPVVSASPCSLLGGAQVDHVTSGASSSQKISWRLLLERAVLLLGLPGVLLFFVLLNLFWKLLKENFKLLFMLIKSVV